MNKSIVDKVVDYLVGRDLRGADWTIRGLAAAAGAAAGSQVVQKLAGYLVGCEVRGSDWRTQRVARIVKEV